MCSNTNTNPKMLFSFCCICIDLKLGCLIIGYLNLVAQLYFVIADLLTIIAFAVLLGGTSVAAIMLSIAVVNLLFNVSFLAFVIVLLVGLHKDKRGHVKAYLIFCSIWVAITFVLVLFVLIAGEAAIIQIIFPVISVAFNIYFLLVIRSYYYKMAENTSVPAWNNSMVPVTYKVEENMPVPATMYKGGA